MIKFTQKKLDLIKTNSARESIKDAWCKNLYLNVTPKGTKTFYAVFLENGKTKRVCIGRYPETTVEEARAQCYKITQRLLLTRKSNKAIANCTLNQLFDLYLESHIRNHSKNEKDAKSTYNNYLYPFHLKKLKDINKIEISDLHNKLANQISNRTANKMLTLLKSMFNRAIDWDIWDRKNPTQGILKLKENKRDRYLTEKEELAFFTVLKNEQNITMRSFFLMLFYTGARRGELMSMRWQDIHTNDKIMFWQTDKTKTGKVKYAPLTKQAIKLLKELKHYQKQSCIDTDYVFHSKNSRTGHIISPQKCWVRICKAAGVSNFRMHDIRHTGATWLAQSDSNPFVCRDYLNHSNLNTTNIYVNKNLQTNYKAINKVFNSLDKRLDKSKKAKSKKHLSKIIEQEKTLEELQS